MRSGLSSVCLTSTATNTVKIFLAGQAMFGTVICRMLVLDCAMVFVFMDRGTRSKDTALTRRNCCWILVRIV